MICKSGVKYPVDPIFFEPTTDADPEVMRIRGYKPTKVSRVAAKPARERTYIMIKPDGV